MSPPNHLPAANDKCPFWQQVWSQLPGDSEATVVMCIGCPYLIQWQPEKSPTAAVILLFDPISLNCQQHLLL